MVTSIGIEETHPVVPSCGIDHLVDFLEGKAVLGAGLVEVGEVYTNPPLPILLLDHYRVGQLLRVVDFPNRLRLEQLLDFFSHGLGLWDPHSASLLDHWFVFRVHV